MKPVITKQGGYYPATDDCPEEQVWYTCRCGAECDCDDDASDDWFLDGPAGWPLCPLCGPDRHWYLLTRATEIDGETLRAYVREVVGAPVGMVVVSGVEAWP